MRTGARTPPAGLSSRLVFGALAVLAILLTLGAAPAGAAVGTTWVKVYQLPDNDQLGDDAVAHKDLRVQAHSEDSLFGLSSVQIDAKQPGGDWLCLRRWSNPNSPFTSETTFDSREWPDSAPTGCSGSYDGEMTINGDITFRVTAREASPGSDTNTDSHTVKLNNVPEEPEELALDPDEQGAAEREPTILVTWEANPEEDIAVGDDEVNDIAEYRYYRQDPAGGLCEEICEFAVSAEDPGEQGCDRSGDTYECVDDYFPTSGYDGTFAYSVVAFRKSPDGVDCALPADDECIASKESDAVSASLTEPDESTPTPSPTGGTGGTGGSGTGGSGFRTQSGHGPTRVLGRRSSGTSEFYTGSYDESLPFGQRNILIPGSGGVVTELAAGPGGVGDGKRGVMIPVAGGLLLFLGAAHARRLLSVH